MSITFDHVEGVVQKAAEPGGTAAPAPGGSPSTKPAETPEAAERRRERLARRTHAD